MDLFHFLYEHLEGLADNRIKPVFPCSSVGGSKCTSFLQGSFLPLLTNSFPSKTKDVLAVVNYLIEQSHGCDLDLHDDFVHEAYITVFSDSDGSFSGLMEYNKSGGMFTRHTFRIKTKPNDLYPRPYTEFLQNKSILVCDIGNRRLYDVGETMSENSALKKRKRFVPNFETPTISFE